MIERINWIDWAKFFAITLVVMGHLPMEHGHPLIVYINCFHMPLFMFLSGYLTKRQDSFAANWKKDWTGIVLPFLLYNLILYPYWAIKAYSIGTPITFVNYIVNPILGVASLSLLHGLVNGPTWFLVALFFSRVVLDISTHLKYKKTLLLLFALTLFILYEINEYYVFTDKLVFIGFARCFPFFLLGHFLKGKIIPSRYSNGSIYLTMLLSTAISITLSLYLYDISSFVIRIQVQLIICISAIISFICLSICLNPIKWNVAVNISIGTIVIFGLHWVCIGSFNMLLQHLLDIEHIKYNIWQVPLLAIVIEAILYPLILTLPPMWLGKRKEIAAQIK